MKKILSGEKRGRCKVKQQKNQKTWLGRTKKFFPREKTRLCRIKKEEIFRKQGQEARLKMMEKGDSNDGKCSAGKFQNDEMVCGGGARLGKTEGERNVAYHRDAPVVQINKNSPRATNSRRGYFYFRILSVIICFLRMNLLRVYLRS